MTEQNKILWQCPTCNSDFDKNGIAGLINKIKLMIQGLSANDIYNDKNKFKFQLLLDELKFLHTSFNRKPTNMMAAQNAVAELENEIRK